MHQRFPFLVVLAVLFPITMMACGGGDSDTAAVSPLGADTAAVQPTAATDPDASPTPFFGGASRSPIPGDAELPTDVGERSRDGNKIEYTVRVLGGAGSRSNVYFSNTYGSLPFSYYPADMTFKVGDIVTFTVIPTEDLKEVHSFSIPDLMIRHRIKYAKTATFEITFDKPGKYFFLCDTHSQEGMTGSVTVQ